MYRWSVSGDWDVLPVQVFEEQNVITYTDEGDKAIGYPTVIDLELHADLHIWPVQYIRVTDDSTSPLDDIS